MLESNIMFNTYNLKLRGNLNKNIQCDYIIDFCLEKQFNHTLVSPIA